MSEETWTISLGARTFAVPPLPFRVSMVVYPLCQKLTNAGLAERLLKAAVEPWGVSMEEMTDLGDIAFLSCRTADPELTREAFDELPITPAQLFDAFFALRVACGGWGRPAEGQEPKGEAKGPKRPRRSTSGASSRG